MAYPYDNNSYNTMYGQTYNNPYMNSNSNRNMYQQPMNNGYQQDRSNQSNMNMNNQPMYPNYSYGNYSPYQYGNNVYQQQAPQTIYHPLTYVSGIEGAKAFVVDPNKKVFLLDSETNEKLFIKYADNEGRYSMKTYKLVSEEDGNNNSNAQNLSSNGINEEYLTTYVANQINQLETKFRDNFDNLNKKLDSLHISNAKVNNNTNNSNNQNKKGNE